MESTLFTTLTANEEGNLSGGQKKHNKEASKFFLLKLILKFIGGAGGAGGAGIINSGSGTVIVNGGTITGGNGGSSAVGVPAV
ncbi:MAG: hypothetical protein V7K48_24515 [Nostoc sp.]|uniref:hypothetical protein n=1 Tax=Nostoc sp. TaxID=1180 RepID=UPI002FF8516A